MAEMIEAKSVACNHCGASLPIASDTRFVTCSYCGSQLEIHRSGPAIYTKVLADVEQRTKRIEEDVRELKLREELEVLQHNWNAKRQELMTQNRDGSYEVPTTAGSIGAAVITVVFGVAWSIATILSHAACLAALFGPLIIAFGTYLGVTGCKKADAYAQAEAAYEQQRHRLLQAIEGESRPLI